MPKQNKKNKPDEIVQQTKTLVQGSRSFSPDSSPPVDDQDGQEEHAEEQDNSEGELTATDLSDRDENKILMADRSGKKRQLEDECAPSGDFSCEMQKMLEVFGADVSKTLSEKRKRLEQFTQTSLKTSTKRVEQIMKSQQVERSKLQEEYCRQAESVLGQWETDIDKMKEQEEKLMGLFKQQQKVFQQTRVIQGQRLKTIRQLQEQFMKGLDELEKCHTNQQSSVQSELKKEMALLQKRILMDMQQREVSNMRKSLQTMLF